MKSRWKNLKESLHWSEHKEHNSYSTTTTNFNSQVSTEIPRTKLCAGSYALKLDDIIVELKLGISHAI